MTDAFLIFFFSRSFFLALDQFTIYIETLPVSYEQADGLFFYSLGIRIGRKVVASPIKHHEVGHARALACSNSRLLE